MRKSIRKSIKKALWPVLAKPWAQADMEFHYGLWNGVSALYSESGRQIGEENTRPLFLNHHVAAETRACKYDGSRDGRLINLSALRIAMQNFDGAAAITEAVRDYHLDQVPGATVPGIWDLYIIARASIALIAFQQRHITGDTPQAPVSDVLASQYQFISGVFMICRHMMEKADPTIMRNTPVGPDALYAYADAQGIFLSANGMACAGSARKITEFLDLCANGRAPTSRERVDLAAIVAPPEVWYQYALATIDLDCFIEEARISRRASGKEKRPSKDWQQSEKIYRSLAAYVRGLMHDAPPTDHIDFIEGALARQNAILRLLGRPEITGFSRKHFAARMDECR